MLTEQDYEMIKIKLLDIIKRGTRMEVIGATKALAELEKAYRFSLISSGGTLQAKVFKY